MMGLTLRDGGVQVPLGCWHRSAQAIITSRMPEMIRDSQRIAVQRITAVNDKGAYLPAAAFYNTGTEMHSSSVIRVYS